MAEDLVLGQVLDEVLVQHVEERYATVHAQQLQEGLEFQPAQQLQDLEVRGLQQLQVQAAAGAHHPAGAGHPIGPRVRKAI